MANDALVTVMQPPVGGLNFRAPAISLDPREALVLDNFFPRGNHVELRPGYKVQCQNIPGEVKSLGAYVGPTEADNRVFAFTTGGGIYDVTFASDAPELVQETAQENGVWEIVNKPGIDQNFLVMVSPSGGYWTYDSVNGFVEREILIEGVATDKRFAAVFHWKDRLWLIENGSTRAYYLGVGSIFGEATEYDFYPVMKRGGVLQYATNWTFNAGYDIGDYLVLVTSQGEVIVYSGYNPDSPETFSLTGVWFVGEVPAGRRSYTSFGGELFILSTLGVVPVSKLVNGQVANSYMTSSANIQPVLSAHFNRDRTSFGWELEVMFGEQYLLVKTPEDSFGRFTFYIMNFNTGAWATISAMPMACTAQLNTTFYFGTSDGQVCVGFTGDNDGTDAEGNVGASIVGRYQSGFQDFGASARLKTYHLARPVFVAEDAPSVAMSVMTRYEDGVSDVEAQFSGRRGAFWDSDVWDASVWSGGSATYGAWLGLQGMSYLGALAMRLTGPAKTQYITTTLTLRQGGVM